MASNRWNVTPAEHSFIVKHQAHITRAELTAKLNDEFGHNLSVEKVRSYTKRSGLNRIIKTMISDGAEHDWIIKHQLDTPRNELTATFNKVFGKSISITQMNSYCNRNKLLMGELIRNRKPVGTIKRHGRFLRIKINKTEWQTLHRYVWEQHHRKKIPDGFMIAFADGNSDNVDVNNLVLVRESIGLVIHYNNRADTDNPSLNKAIMLTASLNAMVRDNERRNKECN